MSEGFEFDKESGNWPRTDWTLTASWARTWPYLVFLILMAIFAIVIFYQPFAQLVAATRPGTHAPVLGQPSADLGLRVDQIQHQLSGLLQSSIETKLGLLDHAVKNGQATPETLKILQDVRSEMHLLALYNAESGSSTSALVTPSRDYRSPYDNESVARDLADLKNMVFVGLGSVGVVAVLLGGCWIRNALYQRLTPYVNSHQAQFPVRNRRK